MVLKIHLLGVAPTAWCSRDVTKIFFQMSRVIMICLKLPGETIKENYQPCISGEQEEKISDYFLLPLLLFKNCRHLQTLL